MSSATFVSRLRSLSLPLLLLLLLQAVCLSASPALAKRAGAFPDFPADYDGRVKKGEYLRTLMPVDNAGAAAANGGASVVSPYQDPAGTARWGWSLDTWWYPYDGGLKPSNLKFLSEAMGDTAFPVDEKNGAVYYYDHDKEFKQANGETGEQRRHPRRRRPHLRRQPPAAGALIFDVNMSPKYAVKEYGLGTVPDMDTLSDFAFFQWLLGCQAKKVDPKSLKVVFRAHITYGPTYNIVLQALKDSGQKRVPGWNDRATFKMGTREGDAILGSTHGAGTAWMLIQHKDALGVKEITEAVVWGMVQPKSLADTPGPAEGFEFDADRGSSVLNIRFTIKDA
uniref:WWE domain-containing protein n=1 Tax=Colletotrichum fructicola (strain Nara gc5) TaxID=1213859 RepID=L2FUP5_COLFN